MINILCINKTVTVMKLVRDTSVIVKSRSVKQFKLDWLYQWLYKHGVKGFVIILPFPVCHLLLSSRSKSRLYDDAPSTSWNNRPLIQIKDYYIRLRKELMSDVFTRVTWSVRVGRSGHTSVFITVTGLSQWNGNVGHETRSKRGSDMKTPEHSTLDAQPSGNV